MSKSAKVLIIAGSVQVVAELKNQLEGIGYPTAAAAESSALIQAAEGRHEIILIDASSAGVSDAFGLARQIQLRRRVPILFLLDGINRDIILHCQWVIPCGFLFKPCKHEEIEASIGNLLRQGEARAPLHSLRNRLERIDECLKSLGTDHSANIHRLTALCGELLEAGCAMYTRLLEGKLVISGYWRLPPEFKSSDAPEGHICYDIIRGAQDDVVFITDLPKTGYARTDPAVSALGFQTYLGRAVKVEGAAVGSLCVLYAVDYQPGEDDRRILGIIASAIGNEDLRQQTKERFFQSEQMMRFVIDNIPHRVFWKDRNSVFLGCNQPFLQDAGLNNPQDIVGRTDLDMAWKELARHYREDDRWVMEHNRARINYEEQQMLANGQRIWIRTSKAPLRDAQGQVIGVLGTYEDITARRSAEQALRASEERYRQIVETAEEGIWLVDSEWKTRFVNTKLGQILGWQPEELRDRTFFDFMDKEDVPLALGKSAVRERGNVLSREVKFIRRDGQELWTLLSLSHVTNEAGQFTGALIMVTDITERKFLEGQLRHAQKMEAMGQLAGGIAHDFNNILTSFIMNIYLLKKDPVIAADSRGLLSDIENDAKRAANLTRQLLLFSRRQSMQFKPLELNETVNNLLKMLRRLLGEHITIEFLPADSLLWIEGDLGMIEQVLVNLCVNSRDAMPQGGSLHIATRRVEIGPDTARTNPEVVPGIFVCLSVRDTGSGMSETMLKHVFEPFFTTKEEGKGTGLGLATVYGIVKQHHGWVEVESALNEGALFRVYLPASPVATASATEHEAAAPASKGRETILLVEDESIVRRTVKMCLLQHGYLVLEAQNGEEALLLWEKNRSDIGLLFTDMVMPGSMTGVDLANRLRLERPALKVIIGSGYSELIVRQGIFSKFQFLAKPYEPEPLLEAIRQTLEKN